MEAWYNRGAGGRRAGRVVYAEGGAMPVASQRGLDGLACNPAGALASVTTLWGPTKALAVATYPAE